MSGINEQHPLYLRHEDGRVERVPDADAEALARENIALREAANEVIAAWDAMDGTELSRGALMGAFGSLRLAIGGQPPDA
jgi:aminoglycoside phosphotransferase (APT) family kinase protein